ncbi:hypothetical protein P9857_15360, partial [Anoxybacillus geothermalis]|nr:hypothetical protein [Anoxybacillus geothermalis]
PTGRPVPFMPLPPQSGNGHTSDFFPLQAVAPWPLFCLRTGNRPKPGVWKRRNRSFRPAQTEMVHHAKDKFVMASGWSFASLG